MMSDVPMSVLYRTDISNQLPQIIGVFSSEEKAIEAMSLDVTDHLRKFADANLNTDDRLTTSVSDGETVLFVWIIVKRDMDCPVFLNDANDIDADGFSEKPQLPF